MGGFRQQYLERARLFTIGERERERDGDVVRIMLTAVTTQGWYVLPRQETLEEQRTTLTAFK